MYFPPAGITLSQHQTFIACYQLGPFACYALVAAFANFLSSDGRSNDTDVPKNADAPWIKATYAIFGAFSGAVHLAVLGCVWRSQDLGVSFSALFVPQWVKLWLPGAEEALYVEESLFFLQWDFILVVLAACIYVERIVEAMWVYGGDGKEEEGVNSWVVMLVCGVACVVVGPGAVVSAVLYIREDFLRHAFAEKEREKMLEKKVAQ